MIGYELAEVVRYALNDEKSLRTDPRLPAFRRRREDPYKMADLIGKRIEAETEDDAKMASQEWERVTHQYGLRPFSAKPAVDLRPSATGIEMVVRYITRAPQRYEVKARLLQAIVELLHKQAPMAAAQLA